MSRTHSSSSRVLVGAVHVSGDISSWSVIRTCPLSDTTGLTASGGTTVPGQISGKITIGGFVDTAASSLALLAAAASGVADSITATLCPDGISIGATAAMAVADETGMSVDASVTAAVPLQIEAMPDGGIDWGVILHALTAETVDANAASVDNGAATAGGGVAIAHVTAYAGLTSAAIKVQHSTDNSSWSDLVTVVTATGTGATRVVVAAGTTVNRYLRTTIDVTGTGSVTFVASFARR